MAVGFPRFVAAAVQAAPVFLNRDATVEKACRLIGEASSNGAALVVFPEVYIPAYPYWNWLGNPMEGMPLFRELYRNAVDVPGPSVETLCQAAARGKVYVVMGVNEREERRPGTLWNTNVVIGNDGRLLGKHRKIVPTFAEKLTWAPGDGSTLRLYETEVGMLGTLACGENMNTLARWALLAQGEQIHAANFPAFPSATSSGKDITWTTKIQARAHALEGKLFNVISSSAMSEEIISRLGTTEEWRRTLEGSRAISGIVGPDGDFVSEPLLDKEGIVYGEVDLELMVHYRQWQDLLGGYNRFDIFHVYVNRQPNLPIRFIDQAGVERPSGPSAFPEPTDPSIADPDWRRWFRGEAQRVGLELTDDRLLALAEQAKALLGATRLLARIEAGDIGPAAGPMSEERHDR